MVAKQMPSVHHAVDLFFGVPPLSIKANPQAPHRDTLHGKFVWPAGEFAVSVELR